MSSLSDTTDTLKDGTQTAPAWAQRLRQSRRLPAVLAAIAVLWGIGTYWVLSTDTLATEGNATIALIFSNLLLVMALAVLVTRRFVRILVARRNGAAGSHLHVRLVTLLSLIAIIPTIIVAFLSAYVVYQGFENWFGDEVEGAVVNSVQIAEEYVEEHKKSFPGDLFDMATVLNRKAALYQFDTRAFHEAVENEARARSFTEAIVLSGDGQVHARYNIGLLNQGQMPLTKLPRRALEDARAGVLVPLVDESGDDVQALIRLDGFFDRYLYASRILDPNVTAQLEKTREHASSYAELESERQESQLQVIAIFVMLVLVMLTAAVSVGIWFATRMIAPITDLVSAAELVRGGDLTARVVEGATDDEITVLSRTFNRMTDQLQTQRNELVAANQQLDHRRRFTEAVLEGVKVGVVGINARGEVDLPNSAALSILNETETGLKGRPLVDAVPEIRGLMARAANRPHELAQEEITIIRQGQARNLLVRVSSERADGQITGFVVTFDDITELVDAQRTAAWADVARRIAHEIKNPLTPIQLSAERLKRKYGREVDSDPEVFSHCTETIIRQVGDIRRMVDEFSGFARMPAPTFRPEDLGELARQTLLFLQVSSPDIDFEFDAPEAPVMVTCDGRQIAQALTNIIKNGVESIHARRAAEGEGGAGGQIGVRVAGDEEGALIEVEDNGLGLPADQRDRLTEPYVTTREKGTGLGLAIVKKIMGDHGGELVLEDRGEQGVRARLVFSHAHLRELAEGAPAEETTATAAE